MDVKIESSWKDKLAGEFKKEYFSDLVSFVKKEFYKNQIYPPAGLIFNAFNHCNFNDLKVVILGQDPYHGYGQAHGLSFSVPNGIKKPPSLQNVFKEIKYDLNIEPPESGDLLRWANQGVLLLNSILTVRRGMPGSHQGKGWEVFTDSVIELISKHKNKIVFMLWGAYAQRKGLKIDRNNHLVIELPHPSPFSADRGFFGSKQFTKCNDYLKFYKKSVISW